MLTHIQIASAKPATKPYKLTDADGLFATVQTNGSKLWRLRYRLLDRRKTLHLGEWPSVSLADARSRREEARRRGARRDHVADDPLATRHRMPDADDDTRH
jgi:hypothetical protein